MATITEGTRLVSRGYAKIVILTLAAIAIGCGLMAYEIWGEFGDMKATKPQIKKVEPLPPRVGAPVAPGVQPPRPGPGPGPMVPAGGM